MQFKMCRRFNDVNVWTFKDLMKSKSCKDFFGVVDLDGAFGCFQSTVGYYFNTEFSLKTSKVVSRDTCTKVKLNADLLYIREHMLFLYRLSKGLDSKYHVKKSFDKVKSQFRKSIHSTKAAKVADHINNSANKQKEGWNIVNSMTPAKNLRNLRVFFINDGDGKLVKEPEIVSNILNRFFTEVPQLRSTQLTSIK